MGFGGDDVIGGGWRREARAAADYHCHFIFIIALVVSKRIKRWLLMFLLAFYVSLNPLGVGSMPKKRRWCCCQIAIVFFFSFFKPTINAASVETQLIFQGEKTKFLFSNSNSII